MSKLDLAAAQAACEKLRTAVETGVWSREGTLNRRMAAALLPQALAEIERLREALFAYADDSAWSTIPPDKADQYAAAVAWVYDDNHPSAMARAALAGEEA